MARRLQVTPSSDEWLAFGGDEWVVWDLPGFHHVRLRVVRSPYGRWIVYSVLVEGRTGQSLDLPLFEEIAVSASDLRSIPLGRIEAFFNLPEVVDAILDARADSSLGFGPDSQAPDSAWTSAQALPLETAAQVSLRLAGIDDAVREDVFYASVAEAFGRALQYSASPAAEIARENDKPITTVHRWLKEARKRGVMPPSRRPPSSAAPRGLRPL